MSKLDELGLQYNTDKSSQDHDYLVFYEPFLEPMHLQATRVMEIGVLEGGSLRVWADYFPNAKIIGLDIDKSTKKIETERIAVEIGNAANSEFLLKMGEKYKPFDLIVDDASHDPFEQLLALDRLFPYVKTGGFYIVEDLRSDFVITEISKVVANLGAEITFGGRMNYVHHTCVIRK